MMKTFLVPALVPHACPKINRSSFLGYEHAFHWCTLLCATHNVFTPLLLRFYGVKDAQKQARASSQSSAGSWMAVGLAAIANSDSCHGHADAAEVQSAAPIVLAEDTNTNPNEQPVDDDKNMDWHQQKKATKRKAAQYVASNPGDVVTVICICTSAINRLTQAFIQLSAQAFDKKQHRRVLEGTSRSFRVLECWKGDQVATFFGSIESLLKSVHPALPPTAFTKSIRTLMFRLLSRAGSSVEHHVRSYHRNCPFALFGVLNGDVSTVREMPPCMTDQLTKEILRRLPTEENLLPSECMSVLVAFATIIDVDILGIEARHSATRRLVVSKSVQTWPVHMQNLSAEWTIRQHRIWKEAAALGRCDQDQKPKPKGNKKKRPFSKKRGGGGPWRAFFRAEFKELGHSSFFLVFVCVC